jgi:hypothetical protein
MQVGEERKKVLDEGKHMQVGEERKKERKFQMKENICK